MTTKTKEDVRVYNRAYRDKNKEKLKQKRKKYNQKPEIRKRRNKWKREAYHKNRNKSLAYSKKYYEAHPIHMREYKHEWYVKNKEKILVKRREDYAIPQKQEKHKAYCREYSRNNRLKINEHGRKYRQTKKGKLVEQNHWLKRRMQITSTKNMLTTIELNKIKKEYLFCIYCGSKKDLTTEHIKAIINGGLHTKENVMIACSKCNASKNSTPLKVWLQKSYCKEKNITWNTIHPDLLKFKK